MGAVAAGNQTVTETVQLYIDGVATGDTGLLSPELALVDPELRLQAVAGLPELEPFDFLRFKVAVLPELREPETLQRRSPLPVAAAAYLVAAVLRVLVFGGMFFLAIAAAVFLLNVLP